MCAPVCVSDMMVRNAGAGQNEPEHVERQAGAEVRPHNRDFLLRPSWVDAKTALQQVNKVIPHNFAGFQTIV